ncbi:MAG: hypothetical protein V2A72_04645 [Candidatus Omnitrophota bacterium]
MLNRFVQDWPAFILLAGILWFFIYVFIHSRQQVKKDKQEQDKGDKGVVNKKR